MGEATFTFRVDEDLKAAFVTAAKASDRTAAQLLRDYMRERVIQQDSEQVASEYDAWFRRQVQVALDDPRPGIPGDQVEAKFAAMRAAKRAALEKKARGQ